MFKRTYTCNVISKGVIRGSMVCERWFWVSAIDVHRWMMREAEEFDAVTMDFRRV